MSGGKDEAGGEIKSLKNFREPGMGGSKADFEGKSEGNYSDRKGVGYLLNIPLSGKSGIGSACKKEHGGGCGLG